MVVDKNAILMRNNNGELVPIEIDSPVFNGKVKIIPMTIGDFNEISNQGDKSNDDKLILDHLAEPKLSLDEIKTLPMMSKIELLKLIMMTSGMSREQVDDLMSKTQQKKITH